MLTILYRLSPRPPLSLLFPYTTLFRSSMLHAKFVNIHPFADGNGRTSRLLMNLELMKTKYPPITIEKDERFKYYEVLDISGVKKDYGPFTEFVSERVVKTLEYYLSLLND